MSHFKRQYSSIMELGLSFVVLLFISYFSYAFFIFQPYIGFFLVKNVVTDVYITTPPQNQLRVGDIIIRVDSITEKVVERDLQTSFLENIQPGQVVEIEYERQGVPTTIQYRIPRMTPLEFFGRLSSQWFIPYIFWLAGFSTLLFLRPRDQQRLLLALFYFVTAAWVSVGMTSGVHLMNNALVLRSLIWLSMPVYLHLHWVFPTPLRRLPGWVWAGLYAAGAIMAVISWLQLVSENFYYLGFAFGVLGSLALLVIHLVIQPGERRLLINLVVALGLALLPVVVFALFQVFNLLFIFGGVSFLGIAALPGFYFFSIYQKLLTPGQAKQASRLIRFYMGALLTSLVFCLLVGLFTLTPAFYLIFPNLIVFATLNLIVFALVDFLPFLILPALSKEEFIIEQGKTQLTIRANRTAANFFFFLLEALAILLIIAIMYAINLPGLTTLGPLLAIIFAGGGTLILSGPFQTFFEQKVLGISISPEALTREYSGRITTSLEMANLQRLLLDEVMPSLLIRQFAQLKLQNGALIPLFSLGITPEMLAGLVSPAVLDRAAEKNLFSGASPTLPAWVRLVIPLRVSNKVQGYWIIGQRDPDDHFNTEDVRMLKTLADQTALALANIEQAENLHALYYADVDRREVERTHLAAELHDDVLNQMAVLSLSLQDTTPAALAAYQKATTQIREIINGLRPAMLNFGLFPALESLVDELHDRQLNGSRLVLDVPPAPLRYDPRVELYLFRIIQQACNNAIQHAQCKLIRISGSLNEAGAELLVSDNGQGFPAGSLINLPTLLAQKHFGLAGMFERAALIGADLHIDSQPGQGSSVKLNWNKK